MKTRKLWCSGMLGLVLALQISNLPPAIGEGFEDGCCIPEPTLIAWNFELEIEAFQCCCGFAPFVTCSEPIAISGGRAHYSGYTVGYRCGTDAEDCKEAQADYDEKEENDPNDMTNFPPIACHESGYTSQASFDGGISADGETICDKCCEQQVTGRCDPKPVTTEIHGGWITCICCFD